MGIKKCALLLRIDCDQPIMSGKIDSDEQVLRNTSIDIYGDVRRGFTTFVLDEAVGFDRLPLSIGFTLNGVNDIGTYVTVYLATCATVDAEKVR